MKKTTKTGVPAYARSDPKGYSVVMPLDEAIHIQNMLAGVWMAEGEGELERVNWEAVRGAANRMAMMCEEPFRVRIPYDRFERAFELALDRLERLLGD
jgi:hypothetical protein